MALTRSETIESNTKQAEREASEVKEAVKAMKTSASDDESETDPLH